LIISDVLPFTVAVALYPSISLISSPLTHCITLSPSHIQQVSAIPLLSPSHLYPLEHLTGVFGRWLMSVTVLFAVSFDTANCDTCVVRTLYGTSFFVIIIIFTISINSSLLLAVFHSVFVKMRLSRAT